jgi:hypothetical protein
MRARKSDLARLAWSASSRALSAVKPTAKYLRLANFYGKEPLMKKFMNGVDSMLHESLAGFAHCHHDLVALDSDDRFVRRLHLKPGKVALISGGGSGHEPLHLGFVGRGMLDAACPGDLHLAYARPDRRRASRGERGRMPVHRKKL